MSIRDANGADVIALGEQQFEDGPAVVAKPVGLRGDFHSLEDRGDAGGEQLVLAFDLDHAQPAGADVGETVEMAQGRNIDVVFPGHFKDRLSGAGAYVLPVNDQRFNVDSSCGTHANTSSGASAVLGVPILHTPAGQRLCTMCSMYSSLK